MANDDAVRVKVGEEIELNLEAVECAKVKEVFGQNEDDYGSVAGDEYRSFLQSSLVSPPAAKLMWTVSRAQQFTRLRNETLASHCKALYPVHRLCMARYHQYLRNPCYQVPERRCTFKVPKDSKILVLDIFFPLYHPSGRNFSSRGQMPDP